MDGERELPAGWAWVRLGDAGEWYGGGTPSKGYPEYWDGGEIPWLSPKDMKSDVLKGTQDDVTRRALEETAIRLVPQGSVAIVTRSGVLEHSMPVSLVPFATTLNQDMKAIVPYRGIHLRWLFWVLRAHEKDILRRCRKAGTTVASLSTPALREMQIPVAPLAEQRRIIATLEEKLSRLEAAQQSLTRAEAMIPRHSRALKTVVSAGRLSVDVKSRSSVDIADIKTQRRALWVEQRGRKTYKEPVEADSDFPLEIPPNWCIASLEQVTDPVRLIRYGILKPKVTDGGVVPYVEVRDLAGCTLSGKVFNRTTRELDEQFSGARLQPGDLLIAVRGSYERSAIVPPELDGANISRDVARISTLSFVMPAFLQIYLQSDIAQRYLKKHARGVAVKGVNISALRAMPIPVPPIEVQCMLAEAVQDQDNLMSIVSGEMRRAKSRANSLCTALLKKAFVGDLVPQDPEEEPASICLTRIADGRAIQPASKRPRKATAKKLAKAPAPRAAESLAPAPEPTPAPALAVQQEFDL